MTHMAGRVIAGLILLAGLSTTAGCGGTGKTLYLDPVTKETSSQYTEPELIRIVIEPFEDRRMDKTRLGMRTHLWGGVTYFNVAGERLGDVIAQALADRLKTRGWKDRSWNVLVASTASVINLNDIDIVISGQILDFSANAKSRPFSTAVTTSSKLIIVAKNTIDNSTTTRGIEGAQHDTVVWFSEEDVQQLLAATLKDGFDRYLADTTIDLRAVRPSR